MSRRIIETPEERRQRTNARARQKYKEDRVANAAKSRERYHSNKEPHLVVCKTWRVRNPEKVKAASRRSQLKQYGLTPEVWDHMFIAQGSCCAACNSLESGSTTGWRTDHNHSTGNVRGILCHHCNVALGHVRDSPLRLMQLISYLERNT